MRPEDVRAEPSADAAPRWHAMRRREVAARLHADLHGLSGDEARRRLYGYGPNSLAEQPRPGFARQLLAQVNTFFIYVLLGCAAATVALGDYLDTAVILSVVVVNAIVGALQERRAERALTAIRHMLAPSASAERDRQRVTLPARLLVPGDVIHLAAGDKVPADARLLRAHALAIQESALTGESTPVDKAATPTAPDAPLHERACMAYAGTLVTRGTATAIVVATGAATALGQIGEIVAGVQTMRTPLLRKLDRFTRAVTAAVLGAGMAAFIIDFLLRNRSAADAVLRSVAIIVAAIPEGLPAVLTVTLAIGVRHMAARRAIVRHLPAVEALGSVTTICSDKTGTMTRNELTVRAVATAEANFQVTGTGYAPAGEVVLAGAPVDAARHTVLCRLGEAAALCGNAGLRRDEGGAWSVSGDPMEGALLAFARKIGHDAEQLAARRPRLAEIPFDAVSRYMATLHRADGQAQVLYVKGAPERLIAMCEREATAAGDVALQSAHWHAAAHALAAQGYRVLALAARDVTTPAPLARAQAEGGLTLLGLVGLVDPPRPEAVAAVMECRRAGIAVKMITGDHPETARWVARRLDLARRAQVITGAQLDRLSDQALRDLVARADVFARTTPEHKLRLVQALQANGEIVAMTGDGVNDAPALKRADVGVAMAVKGTEAAKEAASIVLADDNFASLVAAVREGRTVYDNLTKAIAWTLPAHGGQALFVAAAIVMGTTLPVTPAQILWINTATSATLGLALAFEPAEQGIMRRPPRAPGTPLLSARLAWRVAFVSVLFMLAAFRMYDWAVGRGLDIAHAHTIVLNTIVALDVFYLFSVRFLRGTSLTRTGARGTAPVLWAVAVTVLLQLAVTYLPALQALFDTRALSLRDNLAIVGAALLFFAILETEKALLQSLRAGAWMEGAGVRARSR